MSAITPHYRNVQQLLQSQPVSIDERLWCRHARFDRHYKAGDEARALKPTMMQELLTGKTRLV